MNTQASNPFTGLKGALAGLMSGGLLGLLLSLLFRHRIAPMLAALENLFAQFKAGTLPLPAAPVRATAPAHVTGRQTAAPAAPRAPRHRRRQTPAESRKPVACALALPARTAICNQAAAPMPAPYALRPPRHRARCTKNAHPKARTGTP